MLFITYYLYAKQNKKLLGYDDLLMIPSGKRQQSTNLNVSNVNVTS